MSVKIIVVGDSYTDGTELWEEVNVANYCTMSPDKARNAQIWNTKTDRERKNLTYTGYIKALKPDWEIFNFGKGGASQSMIAANAYSNYARLKNQYPDDKFVCIIQDTYRNRFTFYSHKKKSYEGLNCDKLDSHKKNYPETADLVKFAEKFLNDENLGVQFYTQAMGIQEFFRMQDVPYVNFSFYNHAYRYREDKLDNLNIMKEHYLKHLEIFPNGALERVYEYYNTNEMNSVLPHWHLKGQYHEIVAKDLVEHIERKLL